MAPLRDAVHGSRDEYFGMVVHGETFADFPQLEKTADPMLDQLIGWTRTLAAGRAS